MIVINCRFLAQHITGVQRYAFEIVKRLVDDDRLEVILVSPKKILTNATIDEMDIERFGLIPMRFFWEQIELPLYLWRRGSPVLLSLCNTSPFFYRNSITAIHDLAVWENPKWFSFGFRTLYQWLIPRLLKRVKRIITVSKFSKLEMINRFQVPESKIEVIYNGHEHLNEQDLEGVKKSHSDVPYYLTVGSIDPRKNFKLAIDAFRKEELRQYKLLMVGAGNIKSFSSTDFNDLPPNVEMLGRVSDEKLISLYRGASGFIYPSFYEGFGIPPLEAAYFGIRPILSDIPVFREIWEGLALFIDPNSVDSLADAVLLNEKSPLTDKGRKELAELVESYSWDKSAHKLIELVRDLSNSHFKV